MEPQEHPSPFSEYPPAAMPPKFAYPAGKPEFLYVLGILIFSCLLCNSLFYAGANLGFAVFSCCAILCTAGYLLARGHKLTVYSASLLVMSLVIAASFLRSDDAFVKFVMFCFLLLSTNLGFCLLAGQNRRSPKGIASVLDAFRSAFRLGLGKTGEACRGLYLTIRSGSAAGRKSGAVLLGLAVSLPLLAVVIPLLLKADAAFDSLMGLFPEFDLAQLLISLFWGIGLGCYFYVRGTALSHAGKAAAACKPRKGLHSLTVNTVLIALSLVYALYLFSQLAYFSGGFAGILPYGYTLSGYARRGFFEMAWLCAINLGLIALMVGLVRKDTAAPLLTRLLCLFIGIVTLFLVVSASAKMFLYIDSFGLTRLRVLTEVIMVFFGLATVTVCIWLFVPKLPYMKVILLTALVMGAATAWADVDTQVARYNVTAHQSGALSTIDVEYLGTLGHGAVPYIASLTQDRNPKVAADAAAMLGYQDLGDDIRSWNIASAKADPFLPDVPPKAVREYPS